MVSKNYINNKRFYDVLRQYRLEREESIETGEKEPQIPEYIGEAIYLIATRLARKSKFSGYTYKDEMIADGLEDGIRAVDKFDYEKYQNPFAYFTTVIYYAFVRRIKKEQKSLYIKHKCLEKALIDGEGGSINIDTDYMNNFVTNYEKREKIE